MYIILIRVTTRRIQNSLKIVSNLTVDRFKNKNKRVFKHCTITLFKTIPEITWLLNKI